MLRPTLLSALIAPTLAAPLAAQAPPPLRLTPDTRIVVIGNTFAERLAQSGWFDLVAHAAHPDHRLVIRHVPWSADEAGRRPREKDVPKTEDHVEKYDPHLVLMCYGMSESFAGAETLDGFETKLGRHVDEVRAIAGDDGVGPEVVLVSPIAHEDLGPPWPTSDIVAGHNGSLASYVAAMQRVADDRGVRFVNLLEVPAGARPLTLNGIHPSEHGCAAYAAEIGRQLGWVEPAGDQADDQPETGDLATLRGLAVDKHYYVRLLYRPTNTEYVWGRRKTPFGVVNFPPEMDQLERMIEARERALWEASKPAAAVVAASRPAGRPLWETMPGRRVFAEDAWEPAPVEAKGTETSLGDLDVKAPDDFAASFAVPEGYVIECFASELTIPELQNPLAMAHDDAGRLWVMCAPTYPHLMPGDRPHCKLVIIEDTDGDGAADRRTVFADELYIPTGFAIDTDAVYVGQAPDLLRLRDTDGDDVADRREIVHSGFGMPDSHHTISAFEWDPAGGIMFHEGVFTKSNVETPEGTRRTRDAAAWRFDPRTERLYVMSHCSFANPWGHVFDDYGMSVLADASGGDNYSFAHVISAFEYPRKPGRPNRFLNRGRPTAGCELIASRHFPEDVQETFLVNQSIGFHGTRWDRVLESGSGWRTERMPQDMLECSDTNFRPVAMEIGPDGALYICDWCNPIVGHMQYSVRDPRRDHTRGRIWRIRHRERPLLDPPDIRGASITQLLELLRLPERNTRQHARRRLQTMPADQVLPAVEAWIAAVPAIDPLHARLSLEALWIDQAFGVIDPARLDRVLALGEPRARAGAARVLRHWLQMGDVGPDVAAARLARIVRDADMRVRLEGVVACGFLPPALGAQIAAVAGDREMDDPMARVLEETVVHLGRDGTAGSDLVRRVQLRRMPADKLLAEPVDDVVSAVMIGRSDVAIERRREALAALAGDDPARQAARMVDELRRTRSDDSIGAMARVLLDIPAAGVAATKADLADIAEDTAAAARADAAWSVLLGHDLAAPDDPDLSSGTLVRALALMEPDDGSAAALERVRTAVDAGDLDPTDAIEQVARHATDKGAVYGWLAGHVDKVEGRANKNWTAAHDRALAALRGMHRSARADWPDGFDRYFVEPADAEVLATGREIYHDEIVGCVRCHAADGAGLEGFPPLNRSPWLLGNPGRAASIVAHGLYGPVHLKDGRTINSAMEPLGENLDDAQIAAVLTYARNSWGNFARPVAESQVAAARAATPPGGAIWHVRDILAAYPLEVDGVLFEVPAAAVEAVAAGLPAADDGARTEFAGAVAVPGDGVPPITVLLIALGVFVAPLVAIIVIVRMNRKAAG